MSRTPAALCIGLGVVVALLAALSPWYQVHLNATDSLPGRIYLVDTTDRVAVRGATYALLWKGGYGYAAGSTLLKRVYGLPGDSIVHAGRTLFVAGMPVARALDKSPRGRPLEITPEGMVPEGQLFMATAGVLGFDSRYAAFGTVSQSALLGRAYELY